MHGYDNLHPLMRAVFVARGPAFPHAPNTELEVFQNINVYNMLCDSLGLVPAPNNGTLRLPLTPIGLHSGQDFSEPLQDPEITPLPEATKSIGIDTVSVAVPTTASLDNAKSSDVTPVPSQPSSSGDGEDTTEEEDEEEISKAEAAIKDLWDWFKAKIDQVWNKVSGSS
ncbi:unnamed protein product [Parascedosporium putredinis]|uniref:Uncharacterized protein n=1 Tax=Parascedosporium putredinis TaxID=1442378 RepID=A0A9P1GV05_9PEZI|nr:unnamed protein product [Parascedosporium putredinis]CAI7987843.1 unnamed protein product [Parascedosporium putredinis]